MKKGRGRPTLLETQGEENVKVYVHIPQSIYDAIKEYGTTLSPTESVPSILSKMARKKYDKNFIEKYINELKECEKETCTEDRHKWTDAILCELLKELGFGEVVAIFEKFEKWYG